MKLKSFCSANGTIMSGEADYGVGENLQKPIREGIKSKTYKEL